MMQIVNSLGYFYVGYRIKERLRNRNWRSSNSGISVPEAVLASVETGISSSFVDYLIRIMRAPVRMAKISR